MKNLYSFENQGSSSSSDGKISRVGYLLLQAEELGGVLHFPGTSTMSSTAGMLARLLTSQGGVSLEKMGTVVSTVLQMCFGPLKQNVTDRLVKFTRTYNDTADQSLRLYRLQLKQLLSVPALLMCNRVVIGHILMDASNKKGNELVGKQLALGTQDGAVKVVQLDTHEGISKKAANAAEETKRSLEEELGPNGWAFILGSTTDAASAETYNILVHANKKASELPADVQKLILVRVSNIHEGRVFDMTKLDRTTRCMTSKMHNMERVYEPLLDMLFREQWIDNSATEAQGLYQFSVYRRKLSNLFDALIVESVGGNVKYYYKADPVLTKLFKQIAATRWMTRERQSSDLIKLLNA